MMHFDWLTYVINHYDKRITRVGDMDVSFVLFNQSSHCVGPSVKTDEIRLGPVKCQISSVQKSDIVSAFS
jgi:hypothetical protein